jgi:hypothetical protein
LRASEPMGARYIFCVYIGEDELENIVEDLPKRHPDHPYDYATRSDRMKYNDEYVTLIDSWWGRPIPESLREPGNPHKYFGEDPDEEEGFESWPGSMKFH